MNYVFFGAPEFAAVILEKLIGAGFAPKAAVCSPDRPAGRKKIITPPPAKIVARKHGVPVLQPENPAEIKSFLSNADCQLFVAAAYAKIIPKEILDIPRFGAIGVHPSLLPKHRGPSPIQTAILNGDETTGTTIFLMDEKADHGPIIAQRELELPVSNFQFQNLQRELAELSADLLIEIFPNIDNKIKNAKPQEEMLATYTKKFKTEDGFVNIEELKKSLAAGFSASAALIERKIRALGSEPGIYTISETGQRIKLLEARLNEKLILAKIQVEGKKPTTDGNLIKRLFDVS